MARVTKQQLIDFETEIKDLFLAGKIKAPVHLSGGNEDKLIGVFEQYVGPDDYVFSTWRSHYHALLHGVPVDYIREECLKGNSIALQYPERNFYSSAIVGGIVPIATGVAMSLKKRGSSQRVFCFIGDMAASMGIYAECFSFSVGHNLPISFIKEINGMSVDSPVDKSWGFGVDRGEEPEVQEESYVYERVYPHVGAGKWLTF